MIQFVRTLFGFGRSSGNRKVLGSPVGLDLKHVHFIKESNKRLNLLHQLVGSYRGTPHEVKIKAVFDKTKNIHTYLVGRNRLYELEMFHLQNTDHFISAFRVIIDVHHKFANSIKPPVPEQPVGQPVRQRAPGKVTPPPVAIPRTLESKVEHMLKRIEMETIRGMHTAHKITEMVKRVTNQSPFGNAEVAWPQSAPVLPVPNISIDTFSKIVYLKGALADGSQMKAEIGFSSSDQDKAAFLHHVSGRLGLQDITYAGNAMVRIPHLNGSCPAGLAPIIYLKECMYAVDLISYRLFPVKRYSRSFR